MLALFRRGVPVVIIPFLCCSTLSASIEYFVSPQGSNDSDGRSSEQAFATIQRGVDALEAGDTLTILPGEYFGSVYREGLGNSEVETTIRAQIRGTVLLRGDVPIRDWEPVEGYRFVYRTDWDPEVDVHVVNELDSLTVLEVVPQLALLEFIPGLVYQDRETGKVYMSTPDMGSPQNRQYTASISGTHGLFLRDAVRVTVDGLSVTGFNRNAIAPREDRSQYATWGFLLVSGKDCMIRHCSAWLNGRGFQITSWDENSGDNVIEYCRAWANASQYRSGDTGGFTIHFGRRDFIRHSVAFLNSAYGFNLRSDAAGIPESDKDGNPVFSQAHHDTISGLENNISWGNVADFKIKTGHANLHFVSHCVGDVYGSGPASTISSWIGPQTSDSRDYFANNNLQVSAFEDVDLAAEFADPVNRDVRLQANSRFRGAGVDGDDPGPFPWKGDVVFVTSAGDDAADGYAIDTAWRTLDHALSQLRPGQTLYVGGGGYTINEAHSLQGTDGESIQIRARGTESVTITGDVSFTGAANISFERLDFAGTLSLLGGSDIVIDNCRFSNVGTGLKIDGVSNLRLTHSEFRSGSSPAVVAKNTSGLFVQGNIFDNRLVAAISTDQQPFYSDYNRYTDASRAWLIAGVAYSLAQLHPRQDNYSGSIDAGPDSADSTFPVSRGMFTAAGGPLGTHHFAESGVEQLTIHGPFIHSVTDTTANFEWWLSGPSGISIAWGTEGEFAHEVNRLSHRAGNFSLTGLEPATTYQLRVTLDNPISIEGLEQLLAHTEDSVTIEFTTAATAHTPQTYFVAKDGDDSRSGLSRSAAWRTISHAANKARPGDTIMISAGSYAETVRIRTTGEEGMPITFTPVPGERVELDGLDRNLQGAFVVTDKAHIHFDGLYLRAHRHLSDFMPWSDTERGRNGYFTLYHADNITITRCFSDGRGAGSSPGILYARHCNDLTVRNSVIIRAMGGGLTVWWASESLLLENNVFLRSEISNVGLSPRGIENPAIVRNNIFTDNLIKKFHVPPGPVFSDLIHELSNCFFVRSAPEERIWRRNPEQSLADYLDEQNARWPNEPSIATDPGFVIAEHLEVNSTHPLASIIDVVVNQVEDFDDLFATNPQVTDRNIGLEPEAFSDFIFSRE